jgi:hypothetical protein
MRPGSSRVDRDPLNPAGRHPLVQSMASQVRESHPVGRRAVPPARAAHWCAPAQEHRGHHGPAGRRPVRGSAKTAWASSGGWGEELRVRRRDAAGGHHARPHGRPAQDRAVRAAACPGSRRTGCCRVEAHRDAGLWAWPPGRPVPPGPDWGRLEPPEHPLVRGPRRLVKCRSSHRPERAAPVQPPTAGRPRPVPGWARRPLQLPS